MAFGLRVILLPDLPPGLNMDEGFYGLDSAAVLHGNVQPFYPENGGRESLFMIIGAPLVGLLGQVPLPLRLLSAFFGVLTVAATFALGRRLFRASKPEAAEWIGLAAAALTAGSLWLIIFNRIGLRINAFPFFLAVAAYWFWRAWETRTTRAWLAAGVAFGLVQYTYTAARVLPVVIPGWIGVRAVLDWQFRLLLRRWREWLAFLLAAGLIAAPLGLYGVTHQEEFFRRQAKLTAEDEAGQTPADHYLSALAQTVPMFVVPGRGDQRAYRNYPGEPVFDLAIAPFFLLGLALAIWRFRRPAESFILLWFAFMLLMAAVPLGVAPHYAHDFGMLPVVFLFPALGLVEVARWLSRRSVPALAAATLGILLVAGSVGWAGRTYFVAWAALPGLPDQFDADMAEIAAIMNQRGDSPDIAYVIALSRMYGEGYSHGTIAFLYTGSAPYAWVRLDEDAAPRELANAIGNRTRVVRFERRARRDIPADNKQLLDFLLRRQGHRIAEESAEDYRYAEYQLDAPLWTTLAPEGEHPANLRFGGLTLERWAAGVSPRRDTVWALARWRATGLLDRDLKASIRLRDADGRVVSLGDRDLIRFPLFEPTSEWDTGDQQASYHLLDLPPGVPPGTYTLTALVYDAESGQPTGDEQTLGSLTLGNAPTITLDPEYSIAPVRLGPVSVVGRQLPDSPVRAGDKVSVVLFWRKEDGAGAGPAKLQLVDSGGAVDGEWSGTPVGGRYPVGLWQPGETVRDVIDLTVDPAAQAGPATLQVQWGDSTPETVGEIQITSRQRSYTLPPLERSIDAPAGSFARLAGANISASGGQAAIELVWQATARTERTWKVFVHVLSADGQIVAQSDQQPAGGDAPTTSWLPGEVIIDRHSLTLPSGGPFRLRAGMYDPATGQRVAIGSADSIDLGQLP